MSDAERSREEADQVHPDHSNVIPLRPSDAYFGTPATVRLSLVDAEYRRRARLLRDAYGVPLDAVRGLFAEPLASRKAPPALHVINRDAATILDGSHGGVPEGGRS